MNENMFFELLPNRLKRILQNLQLDLQYLQELRLRIEKPLLLLYSGEEFTVSAEGILSKNYVSGMKITEQQLNETIQAMTRHSMHAHQEEIVQGYIGIEGGHRLGIVGKVVMEGNTIKYIRHISGINIRIAHEIIGTADHILPYVIKEGVFLHTIIISRPCGGKTTLLRDLIRQLSDGNKYAKGQTVAVVDERSEIAACYRGIPQNDIGLRTDVLDACPKEKGMYLLLRSMAPKIIAVDEIGKREDEAALEAVFHCGCKLLATAHADNLQDMKKNPLLKQLFEREQFDRYIVLENLNSAAVYNETGTFITKTELSGKHS